MVRRLVHALVIVLTLIVGAAAAAVIASQTAWFKNWIRAYIVREANLYLNGTLSIERLSGNLLFGLEMENIGVSVDGRQIVAVKDMGLDYNIWDFVTKGLSVDNIRLDKPRLSFVIAQPGPRIELLDDIQRALHDFNRPVQRARNFLQLICLHLLQVLGNNLLR